MPERFRGLISPYAIVSLRLGRHLVNVVAVWALLYIFVELPPSTRHSTTIDIPTIPLSPVPTSPPLSDITRILRPDRMSSSLAPGIPSLVLLSSGRVPRLLPSQNDDSP